MSGTKSMSGMHAWLYIHPASEQRRSYTQARIAEDLDVSTDRVETHTNVVWVTPEGESLKRSEVIKVMNELSLTAFDSAQNRWVVIEDAHRLTPDAANSLLKLIEEPPERTKIALLSPAATLLMSTLRSRTALVVIPTNHNIGLVGSPSADDAKRFLEGTVGERLGIVGTAHKLKQAEELFTALLHELYATRDFPALSWLQEYSQGRASRNTRLILETFAVREWLV